FHDRLTPHMALRTSGRRRVLLGLMGLLLIAACGGEGGGETVSGDDVVVRMFDNRFEFTEIRIPVGGTVGFVGAGRNPHNAVAADGSWSTEDAFGSLEQLEGDEAVLTFGAPGEYVFFCTFHGNAEGDGMAGTLIVGSSDE
ncbi:MAG: cupredoxin domain-containing protein, partial [Acidimicrobiia bacterium]